MHGGMKGVKDPGQREAGRRGATKRAECDRKKLSGH